MIIGESMGICDGVPKTVQSSFILQTHQYDSPESEWDRKDSSVCSHDVE